MMEKRYLELTARGLKIGTNIPMRLSTPSAPLRCGDVLRFELELELPEGLGAALELEPTAANGITLTESPLKAVQRTSGISIVHVPIPMVFTGPPGPTTIEIVLKEGDFGATLGKAVEELTVLPPVIRVSTTESGTLLDPVNGGSAELVLSRHGSDRSRCELELELLDGSGSKVPLKGPTHKDLTLKDELRIIIELVPEERLREGVYSLDATVIHGGIKDRTTLRDMFRVEADRDITDAVKQEEISSGVMIKLFEARPASVLPGGTATITLECHVLGTIEDVIRPVLRIGRTDPVVIEMPPLDPSGLSRSLFVPGHDTPGGDIPCELELQSGDRTLLREVRPRFLIMERSSQMELLIRTPLDLTERRKGPLGGLLLPGELPVHKGTTGELTVWTLNTGRNLIALGDDVLGRENDPPRDREEARGLYVLHCTRKAFLGPGMFRSLVERSARQKRLLTSIEGPAAAPEDKEKPRESSEGWTGAALRWGRSQAIAKGADGVYDDELKGMRSILASLFSKSRDDMTAPYITEALRALLERSVSGLRTSGARPGRREVVKALRMISERCSSSLQILNDAKDSAPIRQAAVDLIISLVLERLVKLEVLTAWDDPAVNAWEDLRAERQRMVKHGISGLLEVPNRLSELERTALNRFDACMRNMVRRWTVASMRGLKGVPGSLTMSGTGGTTWERKLHLELEPGSPPLDIRAYLHLPGRSWQLISPRSERRGELLDMGTFRADGQTPLETVLKVQPPRSPPSEVKGLLYLIPDHFAMEEEP